MGFARPSPPQGLELTAVCDGWRQRNFPQKRVWTALPRILLHSAVQGEGGRVFEEIVVFTSQEMKRRASPTAHRQRNPWSPFLSTYIRPLTHRQLVKTVSKGPLWVLAGLSGSCRLLTAPLQIITTSLLRFYYPLDSLNLKRPTEL